MSQRRLLSGLRRSLVYSLLMIARHCVLRNWDRIPVRAVEGFISRALSRYVRYCDKEALNFNKPKTNHKCHVMIIDSYIIPPSHRGGVLTVRLRRRKMGPERAKIAISVV